METEQLRLFRALIEEGSLLRAARTLGTSRSRLRRKIDALEAHCGVPLLLRGSAGIEPTPAGKVLYEQAGSILKQTEILAARVREVGTEPAGMITIAMPPGPQPMFIHLAAQVFRRRYPKVTVDLRFSDTPCQLLPDPAETALSVDEPRPELPCAIYDLAPMRLVLLASPDYLERHGTPQTPADLRDHDVVVWSPPYADPNEIHLFDGRTLRLEPVVKTSDVRLLLTAASMGDAIAYALDFGFTEPAHSHLVPVLPDVVGRKVPFRMVIPKTVAALPRLIALVEMTNEVLAMRETNL